VTYMCTFKRGASGLLQFYQNLTALASEVLDADRVLGYRATCGVPAIRWKLPDALIDCKSLTSLRFTRRQFTHHLPCITYCVSSSTLNWSMPSLSSVRPRRQ
jgi:hypothetical protein